jgi:hypothetical protein
MRERVPLVQARRIGFERHVESGIEREEQSKWQRN